MARRVRWECPTGAHSSQLGSTRPPKDATVRFCLECSAATGRLVERVAPALVRERAARTATAAARRSRKATVERERAAAAFVVPVVAADGSGFELNAWDLLREAWRTEEVRAVLGETWADPKRRPVPELTIRRGSAGAGRAKRNETLHEGSLPIRARDAMSGHAWSQGGIVLTVHPGLGHEWLRAIVVHEALHVACAGTEGHGRRWRSGYIRAVRELYGVTVRNEGANWQLDEHVAQAIFDAVGCDPYDVDTGLRS